MINYGCEQPWYLIFYDVQLDLWTIATKKKKKKELSDRRTLISCLGDRDKDFVGANAQGCIKDENGRKLIFKIRKTRHFAPRTPNNGYWWRDLLLDTANRQKQTAQKNRREKGRRKKNGRLFWWTTVGFRQSI